MVEPPLPDPVGLSIRHHRAALRWLGLLYRRPHLVRAALGIMSPRRAMLTGLALFLQAVPHVLLAILLGLVVLIDLLGVPTLFHGIVVFWLPVSGKIMAAIGGIAVGIAAGFTAGIIDGISVGVADWIADRSTVGIATRITAGIVRGVAGRVARGIVVGIASGIVSGIAFGIIGGIAVGITDGIAFGIAIGIASGITDGIAVSIAIGIADGIAFGAALGIAFGITSGILDGIAFGIASGAAFGIAILRAYYLPLHLALLWLDPDGRLYRWHPVAWDDLCAIPFPRLDRLLVGVAEREPDAGLAEIERLITIYPSQRHPALRARTTLLARQAGRERDLGRLDAVVAGLPEGDQGFLVEVPKLRDMVAHISALQRRLDTLDRPVFREPVAALLRTEIENFSHRIAGFREPLASEFRAAAAHWLGIAERQWRDANAVLTKESTPQIFRAGDPVDRAQEAFVPRESVLGEIEGQLMLAAGCPGLLLYGRRRSGKSTILRNLNDFLPPTVRVADLSMQNPRAFTALDSLVGLIAERLRAALPEAALPEAVPTTLEGLFDRLATADRAARDLDRRVLIAVDEYENLDAKIGAGVFSLDLLATLRESIQSHRRLIWMLSGSHAIDELRHAPWPSYLVSVRTIEVPMFTAAETRLLLTEPLRHSPLWPKDDPRRPRFDPAVWGEGGIERIHAEAGGWPHLVQLLAETAVDRLNDSDARHLDPAGLEASADKAVVRGDMVLRQLLEGESALPGEWDYLRAFRAHDTQPPPADEAINRSLRRRLLVVEDGGDRWRLRVPLMGRWLRLRL